MNKPLQNIEVVLQKSVKEETIFHVKITGNVLCPVLCDSSRFLIRLNGTNLLAKKFRFLEVDYTRMEIRLKCGYCRETHFVPLKIQVERIESN